MNAALNGDCHLGNVVASDWLTCQPPVDKERIYNDADILPLGANRTGLYESIFDKP